MTDPYLQERLDHYWAIIHKRRALFTTCVVGALLMAAFHNLTARPSYDAVAQILLDPGAPDILSTPGIVDDEQGGDEDTQTQYELLRSRSLAEKALARLGSRADAELASAPMLSPWDRLRQVLPSRTPGDGTRRRPPSSRAEEFRSRVTVEPVPGGGRLVNVRFRAFDPELAAQAANLLVRLYVEQWLEFRFTASREATAWLTERAREEERRLVAAAEALQRYRERERLLSPDEADPALSWLTAALVEARTERIARETLYREMEGRPASELEAFPPAVASVSVQSLKARLAEAREEEARLGETLGDRHPQMIGLRSRIADLEEQVRSEVQAVVEAARADYETAAAREAGLARELQVARRADLLRQRKVFRAGVLEGELESRRQVLQELRRRSQQTRLESQLRATNLRIVETAETPSSPVEPRRWRNYRLSLVLGLAFGVFLCVLLERLDNSVRTPDDLAALGLPFLGFVPRVPAERAGEGRPRLPLVVLEPRAAAAEAYRVVRTNLAFSSAMDRGRVILVSSSSPGEGKTTTAANLAASLALNGWRVLAVDADLRRPALHGQFGSGPAPGLSDVLRERCRAREAIQPTRVKGLQVLPSGEAPLNPAELLGSEGLRRLLAAQRKRYHWIVIDAPPLLAMADAPVLCPLVDGLLLVVWAESTSRPAVQRAVEQVVRVGGRLAGVVLNKVDLERNAYYYAQRYGDYYYNYYSIPSAGETLAAAPDTPRS